MATIHNKITIQATPEKVWGILSDPVKLELYDPVVKSSRLISSLRSGLGSERHCDTQSGWFEDKITECEPYEKLTFTLTACNQPMKSLTHSYTFKKIGNHTEVSQVMKYTMKYGILGKFMDALMGRRVSDQQIKKFFIGLKKYAETYDN